VTNDGATILSLLDIEHPAGKILVDLAQQQDKEVRALFLSIRYSRTLWLTLSRLEMELPLSSLLPPSFCEEETS
jgi:hypothetical protein